MSVRVRIAPSPTGMLHVGNVRTALMNWLFAKAQGGEFMLRIDDTDLERSRAEFETAIEEDLRWLGLHWDLKDWQSKRFPRYDAARDALIGKGLLYPCYETEEELERKRRIAQATGRPPIYDRAALALSDAERAKLEAEGRKPHWRFRLSGGRVEWNDLIRGPQSIDTTSLSDPVLIRGDGLYLYTLPSVVDDAEFAISHVIRGEDHVTNTGVQIEIFRALGAALPAFAHSPLTVAASGEALSKRDLEGPLSVHNLRKAGIEPIAILSLLARIGTSDPVEARTDIMELARGFSFDRIGRAPARFDMADLDRVNAAVLHLLPYADVAARLEAIGADLGENFWCAVRANLAKFADAAEWAHIVAGPIDPKIENAEFATAAAELVPDGALDGGSWAVFVDAVKARTGAKGKALFMPLRQALTGLDHGPEMAPLFALIGREKAIARLRGQAA
jgi:glutamyl-tRNA synthetase